METKSIQSSLTSVFAAFCLVIPASSSLGVDAPLLMDAFTSGLTGETTTAYGANGTASVINLKLNASATNTKKAWLKFDVAGALPTGVTYAHITKATLRVFINAVTAAGSIEVKAIGSNGSAWDELTITYTNSLAYTLLNDSTTGAPYQTVVVSASPTMLNDYINIPVTDLVRDWLDPNALGPLSPLPNNGLVLQGTLGLNIVLDSKEASLTSHPPQLIIEYAAPRVPAKGDVTMGTFINGTPP